MTGALTKVLGAQVLKDVQTFVAAFDTLFGGFRQRAEATYALLQARQTAFVVVATPEPDALREAAYFVERLSEDKMPLAGLVLNRVVHDPLPQLPADRARQAAAALAAAGDGAGDEARNVRAARGLLRLHATRAEARTRQRRLQRRFAAAHPAVATVEVPALAGDVHDVEGLHRIGTLLAEGQPPVATAG